MAKRKSDEPQQQKEETAASPPAKRARTADAAADDDMTPEAAASFDAFFAEAKSKAAAARHEAYKPAPKLVAVDGSTNPADYPETLTGEEVAASREKRRKLHRLHAHARDATVHFVDAPHLYYVDWDGDGKEFTRRGGTSVTSISKPYMSEFKRDATIARMVANKQYPRAKRYERYRCHCADHSVPAAERDFSKADAKVYHGMTPAEVAEEWQQANLLGTAFHNAVEAFYNDEYAGPEDYPQTPEFRMFLAFHHEHVAGKMTPYRTEMFVRTDRETLLAGAIDMLFVRAADKATRTLHLGMYDWKRATGVDPSGWSTSMMTGACEGLKDNKHDKYALQLNCYKRVLDRWYQGEGSWTFQGETYDRVVVDEMVLVVCHPDNKGGEYQLHRVPDLGGMVDAMLEIRRQQVAGGVAHRSAEKVPERDVTDDEEARIDAWMDALRDRTSVEDMLCPGKRLLMAQRVADEAFADEDDREAAFAKAFTWLKRAEYHDLPYAFRQRCESMV